MIFEAPNPYESPHFEPFNEKYNFLTTDLSIRHRRRTILISIFHFFLSVIALHLQLYLNVTKTIKQECNKNSSNRDQITKMWPMSNTGGFLLLYLAYLRLLG